MSFLRGSWVYWVKYLGRNLLLLTPSNPSFVSFFLHFHGQRASWNSKVFYPLSPENPAPAHLCGTISSSPPCTILPPTKVPCASLCYPTSALRAVAGRCLAPLFSNPTSAPAWSCTGNDLAPLFFHSQFKSHLLMRTLDSLGPLLSPPLCPQSTCPNSYSSKHFALHNQTSVFFPRPVISVQVCCPCAQ